MTCKQLGGACDLEFRAETFEEMSKLSRAHGTQMFKENEPAHLAVMSEMQSMAQEPNAMQKWMDDKKRLFESIEDTV